MVISVRPLLRPNRLPGTMIGGPAAPRDWPSNLKNARVGQSMTSAAIPMTWSSVSPLSDEELVARSKTGDAESFNQLVKRWERPIFVLAFRTLGREEDARDV